MITTDMTDTETAPPTCRKCKAQPCEWYGAHGGHSKQCSACNQAQATSRRAAYARRKAQLRLPLAYDLPPTFMKSIITKIWNDIQAMAPFRSQAFSIIISAIIISIIITILGLVIYAITLN